MIRAQVSGRLASDPTSKTSASGKAYVSANFRADVDGDDATWCRLIAFDAAAERLAPLHRGDAVAAVGTLKVKCYVPKNGGDPRPDLVLLADELLSVRRRPKERTARDDEGEHFPEGDSE